MNENILADIEIFINAHLSLKDDLSFSNWYDKECYYMQVENDLLEKLSEFLIKKYDSFYTVENLKKMQKLYILYPDNLPYKVEHLPWNVTCVLVEIFDDDKREFYINLCYQKKLDRQMLVYYLQHELYEKYLYCVATYCDGFSDYDLLVDQVIHICERII